MLENNKTKYNDAILQGQYGTAADILEQTDFDDPAKNIEKRNIARTLRKKQAIDDKIKQAASFTNDGPAIDFMNAFERGTVGTIKDTNEYASKYVDYLANAGGKDAYSLRIKLSNKQYKQFLEGSGITDDTRNNYNIRRSSFSDGDISIDFDKDNPNIISILQGLNNISGKSGIPSQAVFGTPGAIASAANSGLFEGQISVYGLDQSGHTVDSVWYKNSSLRNLINLVNDASNRKNKVINAAVSNDVYAKSTYDFQYIDPRVSEWQKQRAIGNLDNAGYNARVKELEDQMYATFRNDVRSASTIYSSDPKGEISTIQKVSDKDKSSLYNMLCKLPDTKIKFSTGMVNGELGLWITTIPGEDTENNKAKNELGDPKTPHILFIPNYYTGSAVDAFNNDSKNRSFLELEDAQRWGIEYDLGNNTYISNVTNDGAELSRVENGKTYSTPISKKQALTEIHKSIIIDDAVNSVYNSINKNLKTNNQAIQAAYNARVSNEILARINAVSLAAVQELYGIRLYDNQFKLKEDDGSSQYIEGLSYYHSILNDILHKSGLDRQTSE